MPRSRRAPAPGQLVEEAVPAGVVLRGLEGLVPPEGVDITPAGLTCAREEGATSTPTPAPAQAPAGG